MSAESDLRNELCAPAGLAPLARLAGRLGQCAGRQEVAREALLALDELLGVKEAVLLRRDPDSRRLRVTAATGRTRAVAGTEFEPVAAIVMATNRRAPVIMRAAGGAATGAAVPLLSAGRLHGILYVEGERLGAPGLRTAELLTIVAALTAAALAVYDSPCAPAASAGGPRRVAPSAEPVLELVYYQADDTVLCDSAYVVKGAPGRILWALLDANARSGRTSFTNRELRLDESLGLPLGRDNLESRLLTLRRRLERLDCGIELQRVGRGQLGLRLRRPIRLTVVPTSGPMRTAPVPVAAGATTAGGAQHLR